MKRQYTADDLYDGMRLYWGNGVEPTEIYIWSKKEGTVSCIGRGYTEKPIHGYHESNIVAELNHGSCFLNPKDSNALIFN